MKKIFSLGLMLAALALTCCSKDAVEEQMNPAGAGAFELVADLDGGRTVADGIQTAWAAADAINVWTDVSGEKTYTSHGSFAIAEEDLATSTFRGTLAAELTEASYDWYAFYPYSKYNGYSSSSPAKTAYNDIAFPAQQQDGNNNQKHIAGANAPLYGVALDVAAGEKPALQFKHLSTLVKVVVTNATDEPISIKNVKFETETEKISGTFYTNLIEGPSYESSGDSYTYNYVNLAVTGEETIAAFDGKAEFYLNVCPFGAEAAETVTVTVTDGGDQVVTKTYTIPVGSSLSKPGKITTLNFTFDIPEEVEWTTIADIHAATAEGVYNIKNATVVAVGAKNSLLYDGTGYLYSYQTLEDIAVGDIINIMNAQTSTYGERQIKNGATIEKVGTTTVEHPDAEEIADATAYNNLTANYTVGQYVTIYASRLSIGSYMNFYVNGGTATGSFVTPSDTSALVALNGLPAKLTGYVCYLNTSNFFYIFMTEVEALPYLSANPTSLTWDADDTTAKTATISSDAEGWTYTAPDWVTVTPNGTTLTIAPKAANESTEEDLTGEIVLTHATDNTIQAKITITQQKVATGTVVEGGRDDFSTLKTNTSYTSVKTTAGWVGSNCAVQGGGTSNSNPNFIMLGAAANRGLVMNGKTTTIGSITSPTLTTGCGTLTFDYGLNYSDTKISFKVQIIQNETVVKEFDVTKTSATKFQKYSHEEVINIAGDFVIKFTNNCPSNSTQNKDRTTIFNVVWTGYSE